MEAISRGSRIVHQLYGRGRVEALERALGQAKARFDGEPCPRRVLTSHLVPEPPAMPPCRPELTVVQS